MAKKCTECRGGRRDDSCELSALGAQICMTPIVIRAPAAGNDERRNPDVCRERISLACMHVRKSGLYIYMHTEKKHARSRHSNVSPIAAASAVSLSRTHNALSDIITYLALNVGHRQQSAPRGINGRGRNSFVFQQRLERFVCRKSAGAWNTIARVQPSSQSLIWPLPAVAAAKNVVICNTSWPTLLLRERVYSF